MGNSVQASAGTVVNSLCRITSRSLKSTSKDDLIKGLIVNIMMKEKDKLGNSHSEVGDSVVDCLLL